MLLERVGESSSGLNDEFYWNAKCLLQYHILYPVLSLIWRLETPRPSRKRPMQVLALGPSHSSTEALRTALRQLGYGNAYCLKEQLPRHGAAWSSVLAHKLGCRLPGQLCPPLLPGWGMELRETFEPMLSTYEAVTGQVAAVFGEELATAYPEAKIILNRHCNVDEWARSTRDNVKQAKAWAPWLLGLFSSDGFWRGQVGRLLYLAHYYGDNEENMRIWHDEHFRRMRENLEPGTYLEWCVEDGWEPLCNFLGKPIPILPFPGGFSEGDFQEVDAAQFWKQARMALLTAALLLWILMAGMILGARVVAV